jgi:hypothetical protein
VAESELENEYKVFPSLGLVVGFQYKGRLATVIDNREIKLTSAGITGVADGYKVFKNSADIGTLLVYFTDGYFGPNCARLFGFIAPVISVQTAPLP